MLVLSPHRGVGGADDGWGRCVTLHDSPYHPAHHVILSKAKDLGVLRVRFFADAQNDKKTG